MNDTPAITLDRLRSQLTVDQRAILNTIWGYYQDNAKDKRWISTRRLHKRFGKGVVHAALKGIGGSVVREDGYGPDAHYSLTFLGVLLTDRGTEAEALLIHYLQYIGERFEADPDIQNVSGVNVELALTLAKDESHFLMDLINWGHFRGSSASFGELWHADVPNDVEELPQDAQELRAYVHVRALEMYDPNLPFEENKRASYSSNKPRGEEPRSPFWFIANPELLLQLTEDWQEAQNVHPVKAWKSCVILCGGILEGMLLDALVRNEEAARAAYQGKKKKPPVPHRWDLAEMVDTASKMGILKESDVHLGHALREFRNLIHPGRQVREKVKVTEHEATIALSAVKRWLQVLAPDAGA